MTGIDLDDLLQELAHKWGVSTEEALGRLIAEAIQKSQEIQSEVEE
ncbi:MAG: hypothetical protein H0Z39_03575 [Peptococcaceae bacterium]|nr:hypothetical protein [Peptococcaceae bacterium]